MHAGKYLLMFFAAFIAWGNVHCQLAVYEDEDAIVSPGFNEAVLRIKKVSEITMHHFSKPDGLPILDEGVEEQYYFDTAGKITQSMSAIEADDGGYDTLICNYEYDKSDNIIVKRTETGSFFDTWYFQWYNNNLIKTVIHVHEISDSAAVKGNKMTTQETISADSFAYISYPKQLQQYEYNEDNKYFRKTFTQYDDNKRMVSRNSQFLVGSLYSQVDITYDTSGRITGIKNEGNINGERNQNTTTQYDSIGKVYEQNITVNGKLKHKIEFMYDTETGLISNKLDRDNDKSRIYIIRYSYEMYDDKKDSAMEK